MLDLRHHLLPLLGLCFFAGGARAETIPSRFTGEQSCASSSCHGGGVGKDQCLIWEKKDVHTQAHAILANNRSARMAETLGIADATKDARCTICHSPFESLSAEHFVLPEKREKGVSCETCHGAAENWLRFHTRRDVTHDQRVGQGLREVKGLYARTNVCVACHLNITPELVAAGHPEMFFELDGQTRNQPPHWKEEADPWLGPRAWLVGQASSLREISWKLTAQKNDDLVARWNALRWLLKQVPSASQLPDAPAADYRATQSGADRLARASSNAKWSKDTTLSSLRRLAAANAEFRDAAVLPNDHRRRAELVVLGIDRLWQALKTGGLSSANLETALGAAAREARAQAAFVPDRFAAALQQIEVELELLPK